MNKTIKIKLTGDGTNIGHGVHVVVFGFMICEEGGCSGFAYGNNPVCLLKEKEDYEHLRLGLQDVSKEIEDGVVFKINFYLGGDWKFLACVCVKARIYMVSLLYSGTLFTARVVYYR